MPSPAECDSETEEALRAAAAETEQMPMQDVEDESESEPEEQPLAKPSKREKKFKYRGITLNHKKYCASVIAPKTFKFPKKKHNVGNYSLKADAALAADKMRQALGVHIRKLNFTSMECYEEARALELEEARQTVEDVGSVEDIISKIEGHVSRNIELSRETVPTEPTQAVLEAIAAVWEPMPDVADDSESEPEEVSGPIRERKYRGVGLRFADRKFSTNVVKPRSFPPKNYFMGRYWLKSDAALAVDKMSQVFGVHKRKLNFSSMERYEEARALELEETGETVENAGSVDDIISQIKEYMTRNLSQTPMQDFANEESEPEEVSGPIRERKFRGIKVVGEKYSAGVFQPMAHTKYNVGTYWLKTDAALAADKMSQVFGVHKRKLNFASMERYEEARALELEERGETDRDVGSVDEILSRIQKYVSQRKSQGQRKSSQYKWVYFLEGSKRYCAAMNHQSQRYAVGSYWLETDAAMAVDVLAKSLSGLEWNSYFSSHESYRQARALELDASNKTIRDVGSIADLFTKIQAHVNQATSPKREVQRRKSQYTHVSYVQRNSKYQADICVTSKEKRYKITYFILESDAAFAADKLIEAIAAPKRKINFESFEAYLKARELEVEEVKANGVDMGNIISIDQAIRKIRNRIRKIESEHLNIDDAKSSTTTALASPDNIVHPNLPVTNHLSEVIATLNYARNSSSNENSGARYLIPSSVGVANREANPKQSPDRTSISKRNIKLSRGSVPKDSTQDVLEAATAVGESIPDMADESESKPVEVSEPIRERKFRGIKVVGEKYSAGVFQPTTHTKYNVGTYWLKTDAALAADKMSQVFGVPERKLNFSSMEHYEEARALELEERGLGETDRDVGSVDEILSRIQKYVSQRNKKASPTQYKGVFSPESSKKYKAALNHQSQRYYAGAYWLQADAAMAVDILAKSLSGFEWTSHFSSHDSYRQARALELDASNKTIKDVGSIADVFTKIQAHISQATSPKREVPKRKYQYNGVCYFHESKKYQVDIHIIPTNKRYRVSHFVLASDAAFAADKVNEVVGAPKRKINFASFEGYLHARELELEEATANGVDMGKVMRKIRNRIRKIESEHLNIDDGKSSDTTASANQDDIHQQNLPVANHLSEVIATLDYARSSSSNNTTPIKKRKAASPSNSRAKKHKNSNVGVANREANPKQSSNRASSPRESAYPKKKSAYNGVSVHQDTTTSVFSATLQVSSTDYLIDTFALESDAAFAVDCMALFLGLPNHRLNFTSFEEYERIRALEQMLTKMVYSVDSVPRVCQNIQSRVREVASNISLAGLPLALPGWSLCAANSFASGLHNIWFNQFAKLMQYTTGDVHNQRLLPIAAKSVWIQLHSSSLPFPPGCTVMTDYEPNNRGEYIQSGKLATVTGAFLNVVSREIFYSIMRNKTVSITNARSLAFAPGCPIQYFPLNEENCLQGRVHVCQTKRYSEASESDDTLLSDLTSEIDMPKSYYTIIVFSGGPTGNFRVIQDVPSDRLRFNGVVVP